jgi:hypothetical protein
VLLVLSLLGLLVSIALLAFPQHAPAAPTPTPTRGLTSPTPTSTPGPGRPTPTPTAIPLPAPAGGVGGAGVLTLVSLITSVTSLLGLVSTTVLGWRRESRESKAAELDRQRQELEIEKLRLELERERTASRRTQELESTVSDDLAGPLTTGGRARLSRQLGELQAKYDELTRRIGAVDADLRRTLDSEQRLILEIRRQELTSDRAQVSALMSRIESRLGAPKDADL